MVPKRVPEIADRISASSVTRRARLYLITSKKKIQITATGGVPGLEKSIGDREVSAVAAWADAPGDERWARPATGDVLRAMDRFHPIPESRTSSSSWAEWLYFNGRTRDGRVRLYLTFFVGRRADTPGMRQAGVRLQLDRDGRSTSYSSGGLVDEASMLAGAPDLDIGGSRVRLEGSTYRIQLALPGLDGAITLDAAAQRSMPPAAIRGAGGWVSIKAPFEMQVLEGGKVIGSTGMDSLMLPAGSHDLEVSAAAFSFSTTMTVKVPAGKTVTVPVTLPKNTLSINALPWADVTLDGQPMGQTPLGNLSVSIGNHEIVWRHPQLGERRQVVKVTAGTPVRAGMDLTK